MRHYGKGLVSILLAIVLVLTAVPILAIGKPKTVTAMHVVDFTDDSRDGAVVGEILDAVFCVEDPTRNIVLPYPLVECRQIHQARSARSMGCYSLQH